MIKFWVRVPVTPKLETNMIPKLDSPEYLAHKTSAKHKDLVDRSDKLGCFQCLKFSDPSQIEEWCDGGQTALCPYCGIDSLVPDASGYLLTKDLLIKMNKYWFGVEK